MANRHTHVAHGRNKSRLQVSRPDEESAGLEGLEMDGELGSSRPL